MRKATTLAEAVNVFNPAALEFDDRGSAAFYVERPDTTLELLRTQLLDSQAADKILLAGHRGCGKSTELNRLAADPEVRARYRIVKFSVNEALALDDLTHIDLLVAMVGRAYVDLTGTPGALSLKPDTVERLTSWQGRVVDRLKESDESAGAEFETDGRVATMVLLNRFFARLAGRLKIEHTTRSVIREVVQPRLSEFVDMLDAFFEDVHVELKRDGKRLLLILEDLDKIPNVDAALTLFRDNGAYLARPASVIVYTVPIAIYYSKDFQAATRGFGRNVFLPNVRMRKHGADAEDRAGVVTMERFVTARMDEKLVAADALREAALASGGIFEQLQRLMRDACTWARVRKQQTVTVEEVHDAVADLRAELERTLADTDYPILEAVARTKDAPGNDDTLALLHSLHLVEYRNRERWCDVNPVLEPTLVRRRRPGFALTGAP